MAVTRLVNDKPLTFNGDLDLGRGNLNFVRDTPSQFALPLCENLMKFPLWVFELWLTQDL